MKRKGFIAMLAALFFFSFLVPAMVAEDSGIKKVRLQLDAIEKDIAKLKKGDGKTANELINKINAAKADLNKCDAKDPDWAIQANRSVDLDAWVRAAALGQPRPKTDEIDEYIKKAQGELEAVEKDLAVMKPGDLETANALVNRLNAVRDTLSKSTKRTLQAFKDAAAKANEFDKQVRERYAQASSPNQGSASQVPVPSPLSEDIAKGMNRDDKYAFTEQFLSTHRDFANQLAKIDPTGLADEWTASKFTDGIARMRTTLKKLGDQKNTAVKDSYAWVDSFERAFLSKQAAGVKMVAERNAKASAEAASVDAQLNEISAFFDPNSFDCALKAPFTSEKVRAWVAKIKEYQALRSKGIGMLDKLAADYPNYAQDARVKQLRYWFSTQMPKLLAKGIGLTTGWYTDGPASTQGEMVFLAGKADNLLGPSGIPPGKLEDDRWVQESLAKAEDAAQAADALVLFYKEYKGEVDETYINKAASLHSLVDKIRAGSKSALKNVRMPESASADPKLLATAKEVLEKIEAGPYERMVINYELHSKSEDFSEARLEGDLIKVWKWTEEWDEYQVTVAELFTENPFDPVKIAGTGERTKERPQPGAEGEYRLVSYTLKYLKKGPPWKTVGSWICSDRIVGMKIPKENIGL